jgi:hypothetical protein
MQFSSTYRNSYDQQRNDYSLSLNNNTSQSIFNVQEFIKKKQANSNRIWNLLKNYHLNDLPMDDQIQIALSLLHSIEKLTEAVIHHNIQQPYTGLSNQSKISVLADFYAHQELHYKQIKYSNKSFSHQLRHQNFKASSHNPNNIYLHLKMTESETDEDLDMEINENENSQRKKAPEILLKKPEDWKNDSDKLSELFVNQFQNMSQNNISPQVTTQAHLSFLHRQTKKTIYNKESNSTSYDTEVLLVL